MGATFGRGIITYWRVGMYFIRKLCARMHIGYFQFKFVWYLVSIHLVSIHPEGESSFRICCRNIISSFVLSLLFHIT